MTILEFINIPLVIGAIGTLLFFIWLGRHAERVDKKHEDIQKSQSMRKKWQKMKRLRK